MTALDHNLMIDQLARADTNRPAAWGLDVSCERDVLAQHDIASLARRAQHAIIVRGYLRAAAAGAVVALTIAGAGALAVHTMNGTMPVIDDDGTCQTCAACDAVTGADAVVIARAEHEPAVDDPADAQAAASEPDRPPASANDEARAKLRALRVASQPQLPPPPALELETNLVQEEQSRLRVQLDLYERARHALASGELDDATTLARTIREKYDDGPLAIEAGILEARALVKRGDVEGDEAARKLLPRLRSDARASARKAELHEIALLLPWPPVIDEPRKPPPDPSEDAPYVDAQALLRKKFPKARPTPVIGDPAEDPIEPTTRVVSGLHEDDAR